MIQVNNGECGRVGLRTRMLSCCYKKTSSMQRKSEQPTRSERSEVSRQFDEK
jgi:hypothetical protein